MVAQATIPILRLPETDTRRLIAIAGPPASGKSTLAKALVEALCVKDHASQLLPMDGFHLDNATLDTRGLRARKGAPETFDLAGFNALLTRTKIETNLRAPAFDRTQDAVIEDAIPIDADTKALIVEGNYLLLDAPGWRDLHALWDFSVFLPVDTAELHHRLVNRWLHHGLSHSEAEAKAQGNDLPNAELVLTKSLPSDLTL